MRALCGTKADCAPQKGGLHTTERRAFQNRGTWSVIFRTFLLKNFMSFIKELLSSWHMPHEVIKKFEDEMFTEHSILTLNNNDITSLIPWQGPRSLFLYHWKIFKEKFNTEKVADNLETTVIEPVTKKIRLDTDVIVTDNENIQMVNLISALNNVIPQESCTTSDVIMTKTDQIIVENTTNLYAVDMSAEYDLLAILNESTEGQCALTYYASNKNSFNNTHRCKIAHCIIERELVNTSDKSITTERLKFLANQIVIKFPQESLYTWFDDTGNHSKGKLFTQYHSIRRKFRKSGGILKKTFGKNTNESVNFLDEKEDVSSLLLWLNSNTLPKTKVEEYWTATHPSRMNSLFRSDQTIYQYYKNFPALSSSTGYTLLEIDYDYLHPNSSLNLYTEWPNVCQFTLDALKQKDLKASVRKELQGFDHLSEDQKAVLIFASLHLLFPVITVINKNKKSWRPSKEEMQEAFLLHCKTVDDIKVKIALRRQKLSKWALTLQPMAVIVGPSLQNIIQSYVVVDEHFYAVESTIKAIDVTFKSLQSLNAKYPPESEQAWLFIQLGIYDFTTPFDKKLTDVRSLVHQYKKCCQTLPSNDTQELE